VLRSDRWDGWFRGRRSPRVVSWHAVVAERRDVLQKAQPITERRDAEFLEISVAQLGQEVHVELLCNEERRGDAAILTKIAWGYNEALRVD